MSFSISFRQSQLVLFKRICRFSSLSASHPPPIKVLTTPEDNSAAQRWVDKFKNFAIPKSDVEISFSRSSGPGGQNVNKVNTKATVRCPLDVAWIPLWSREGLRRLPSYVSSSSSLLVTSTQYRSQAQNLDDCLAKLHAIVLSASTAAIKTEPSEATAERVRRFALAEKAHRREGKEYRSDIKKGRKKPASWD